MLSVIMLNVVMLRVGMPSVMAPFIILDNVKKNWTRLRMECAV